MNIAFVTPFFGAGAAGGAESECRNTAMRLAERGHRVDILTTCLLDLQHDWNTDAYPAGTTMDHGVTVRRFRSGKVDLGTFARLNRRIIEGDTLSAPDAARFAAMHINSFDLLRFLDTHQDACDWVCFIPYLFGTSIHGSRLCPEKNVLIPCLHDEGYARLQPVRDMFRRAARVVYHTEAERRLAHALYGELRGKQQVIGEGVETHLQADAERFRSTYGMEEPFVLCCGRKDETKNTPELIRYFRNHARVKNDELKLVLIGPASADIPADARENIIDLGFVPYQHKLDAYAACTVFCQPSLNESFSLVLMEAWDLARPALVHEKCDVTREHVVAAGGGLYYRDAADFSGALSWFLDNPETAAAMGNAGRNYVRSRFAWPTIMERYEQAVFASPAARQSP